MNDKTLIHSTVTLLLCSPLFAGCLLTVGDGDDVGDDTGSASDTDDPSDDDDDGVSTVSDTQDDESSSGVADESSDDGSVDDTTGGPVGECSETRILDGGFEAGTPSEAWAEASDQFGTPICDDTCSEEEGAVAYAGDWFAWFGGVAEAENASVSQSVTLDGMSAYLSFRFQINAAAGTGDDVFTVTIDGETVFMATDLEQGDYTGYTPLSIEVSEFIGAGEHVVEFSSTHAGTGMSSFFLDEVALVTCDDAGGESSSSDDGSDSSDTTAADSSSGDDTSDDGSSSDSSSDDGASESSSTGM